MPFRDLLGHRPLIDLLRRAVERGTLPPTLLFAGPTGVGKWLVAQALAQTVNCPTPVDGDACGSCRSCDRVARGLHVDVIALEPDDTGKIKIDVVRDVLDRCGYRPFEGQRRFVLVRDADSLLESAQNALLKSLEEPPPATVFVLTSAAPDSLLRTVRSRTMRLTFGRLASADIETLLVSQHDLASAEAHRLAMLSDGSVGAALALASTTLADTRDAATDLLSAAGAADLAGRIAIAKSVVGEKKQERDRREIQAVIGVAASIVRDVSVLHARADRRLLANADLQDRLDRLARLLPPARAEAAYATLDRARSALERNAGPKLVVEWVASEL